MVAVDAAAVVAVQLSAATEQTAAFVDPVELMAAEGEAEESEIAVAVQRLEEVGAPVPASGVDEPMGVGNPSSYVRRR